MRTSWPVWFLLALAVLLRLATQDWSSGLLTPHPDERQVAYVAERTTGWLDDPEFFAYGSLHFQLIRAVTAATFQPRTYRHLLISGRALSLLASVGAILIAWAVARRAWGWRTGLWFLALAAWIPLDLQQSHYATVEAHHAFWVVLTLAGTFWLARSGSALAAVGSGAAAGLSLAVKVASLPLGAPIVVALVACAERSGPRHAIARSAAVASAGLAAFWIGQPWAFADARPPWLAVAGLAAAAAVLSASRLRAGAALPAAAAVGVGGVAAQLLWPGALLNPAYLRGVGEQLAMVTGRSDLAYVRVYDPTLPVLYPLRELALWAVGPVLAVAVLAAVAWALLAVVRRWRRWLAGRFTDSWLLVGIVLAWLVPTAARFATLEVKYLRYWQPLIIPAALLTVWALTRMTGRWRQRALATVVAATAVWGLAYIWAFADPHPHRTASRWLESVLPADATVALEHWDEGIELPSGVRTVTLPSYELPDTGSILRSKVEALAEANWLVMTSHRVRRTVLANRDRYPATARLYTLLLAGEIGYQPLTTAERGPHILGLRLPVQLADESFVNYDFPRVVVLQRLAELDVDAVISRLERPLPWLEELGPAAVERRLVDPLPKIQPAPSALRQLLDLTVWIVVLLAIGAAAWVLLLPLLASLPDAGAGLALTTGWIGFSWLVWFGSELGVWKVSAVTVSILLLAAMAGAGIVAWRRRCTVLRVARRSWPAIARVAVVTGVVLALFLGLRLIQPAVFWGEKPMDFSFLNAFVTAPEWPPGEPWMAGMPLNYYYFGEVLAATPILASGASAGVGYNLAAATVPAMAAAALATLSLAWARRRTLLSAALAPGLALLIGNLSWPLWLALASEKGWGWFDLWWATSRVIPGFAIDEYPLWTASFADLHAHLLALPVVVVVLAWGWWTLRLRNRRWWTSAAICGVAAGVAAATNPWDVVTLSATFACVVLLASRQRLRCLLRLGLAAAVAAVAAGPFLVELARWLRAGIGGGSVVLNVAGFAPAWAVLLHFGVFLIPLSVLAAGVAGRRRPLRTLAAVIAAVAAGPLLLIPVASVLAGKGLPPAELWLQLWLPFADINETLGHLSLGSGDGAVFERLLTFPASAVLLGIAGLAAAALYRARSPFARLGWSLTLTASGIAAACEWLTLIDRMNTVFKVYNTLWVILALALTLFLLRTEGRRQRVVAVVAVPLIAIGAGVIPLTVAQAWATPRIESPRPTLDGQAYLDAARPETWRIVRYLTATAEPGDVVAEAAGSSYGPYTRITMHTGLPIVVGWQWHLQQRGQPVEEIRARFADLETLYRDGTPQQRRTILDRYRIRWLVVGDLERRTYTIGAASDTFEEIPGVTAALWDPNGRPLVYHVQPSSVAGHQTSERPAADAELPADVAPLTTLPAPPQPRVRALSINDEDGGVIVLADGSVALAGLGGRLERVGAAPCDVIAGAHYASEAWVLCRGGGLLRWAEGRRWRRSGHVDDATGLAANGRLWAWGPSGAWSSNDGRRWQPLSTAPIRDLASSSEGTVLLTQDGTLVRFDDLAVPTPPVPLARIAWSGGALWAVDQRGALWRSGGGMLPWRVPHPDLTGVAAIAGSERRLWLVTRDGVLAEIQTPPPVSPFRTTDSDALGSFREPRAIAMAPEGWMAVADTRHYRIQFLGADGSPLGAFGHQGTALGELEDPAGVAISADGRVAIADTWNGRVQILEPDGSVALVDASLYGPRAVLWSPDGALLIADTGNSRVLRCPPGSLRAEPFADTGGRPMGMAWTREHLAVAVPDREEVVVFDASGREVSTAALPAWAEPESQEAFLASRSDGTLLATAPGPGELWLLDPFSDGSARLLASGLNGLTGVAVLDDRTAIGALTWDHRLVRLRIAPSE